jgi:hypothetical protein
VRFFLAALAGALLALPSAASAAPACFGAAARDPLHPCANPALRLAARPGLTRSLLSPSYPCRPTKTFGRDEVRSDGALTICQFGTPRARATRTVALLGDSHAMAWRAAVAGALERLGWHGVSMARSHCAFSAAVRDMDGIPAEVDGCYRFNQRVLRWLRHHDEVTAVFAAHETGGRHYINLNGVDDFDLQVFGFATAWAALPKTVTQVFAIRDNPMNGGANHVHACVETARRADAEVGSFCARPRSEALVPDAHVDAIAALADPRYALIDLTDFMCDPASCFPVVGGALVTKDGTHLTRQFSASLAPYLTRAVRALL